MRALLILLFGLILNSPISAVFSGDSEDDYPVVVESFVANHEVHFQEWPEEYKDFLGAACMALVRSEVLSKDVIDQDAYFVMDDLIGKYMQILTYVKTGPQYITEENYRFFKNWAPKKCHLLTDSSLLPICFFRCG